MSRILSGKQFDMYNIFHQLINYYFYETFSRRHHRQARNDWISVKNSYVMKWPFSIDLYDIVHCRNCTIARQSAAKPWLSVSVH